MRPLLLGDDLHQIEFNLCRIIVIRQTNSLTHPVNMSIDRNAGTSKGISQNDIRCLPAHSWKGDQFLQGFWDVSLKPFYQFLTTFLNRLGFISIESGWPDLLFQFGQI